MQYLGGKFRIAEQVCYFLEGIRGDRPFLEPFVGGCNIVSNMQAATRTAADSNTALITLYQALQQGWVPPTTVSEEEYAFYKAFQDAADPMTAFCGIGCSFSGKWFGGYSRDKNTTRNYALNAFNTLNKLRPKIADVQFIACSYDGFDPEGNLIYCDPTYANTTGYKDKFYHDKFYDVVRKWAKSNVVVISEYQMPDDFECVLEIPTKTDMRVKNGSKEARIEKLFMVKG